MNPTDNRKQSRLRSLLGCALSLALVSLTVTANDFAAAQLLQQAAPNPGPALGRSAIAFNLQTINGQAANLDTFRGKPLIMNFFASWRDPCREEMPLINELAAKTQGNCQVLGIAVEDTRAAITEYVNEARIIFPVALDLNSTVKRSYRIFGPPATFFIDGQGVIRDMVLGPLTRERALEGLKKITMSKN